MSKQLNFRREWSGSPF